MVFDIPTILSITHEKLLTDIGNVYKILNHMTGDSLYTHVLPRAGRACTPELLRQFPELTAWDGHSKKVSTENVHEYIAKALAMFGEERDVAMLPVGVWDERDPVEELCGMVGSEKVIALEIP